MNWLQHRRQQQRERTKLTHSITAALATIAGLVTGIMVGPSIFALVIFITAVLIVCIATMALNEDDR